MRAGMLSEYTNQRVMGVVENMSAFPCPHCGEPTDLFGSGGGEIVAKQLSASLGSDVPLLGQIPVRCAPTRRRRPRPAAGDRRSGRSGLGGYPVHRRPVRCEAARPGGNGPGNLTGTFLSLGSRQLPGRCCCIGESRAPAHWRWRTGPQALEIGTYVGDRCVRWRSTGRATPTEVRLSNLRTHNSNACAGPGGPGAQAGPTHDPRDGHTRDAPAVHARRNRPTR